MGELTDFLREQSKDDRAIIVGSDIRAALSELETEHEQVLKLTIEILIAAATDDMTEDERHEFLVLTILKCIGDRS